MAITKSGSNRMACSMSRFSCVCAESAVARSLPSEFAITCSVFSPMLPVEPKTATFFVVRSMGALRQRKLCQKEATEPPAASKNFDPEHGFGPRGLSRVRKMELLENAIQNQATHTVSYRSGHILDGRFVPIKCELSAKGRREPPQIFFTGV